jgi:demethylmenaquinone methyltransferase/2-methoxy-6-polyprenyl-1,4-benzoquinol methylase
VRRLPYADESFDVVASAHVLEHLPDPAPAIAEMARVLRPGGKLLLVYTRGTLPDALVRLRWAHVPLVPAQLRGWLAEAGLGEPTPLPFGRPGSVPRWLSAALLAARPER